MEARANSKSLIWLAVINLDKERASLDSEASAVYKRYQGLLINCSTFNYCFTIVHDKDPNKRPHLHAFIQLYEKATKKAVLSTLTELLNINTEQVSLEASNSLFLGVQYLTHKNQPDKEAYSIDEVVSSNNEEFLNRWAMEYTDPKKTITEAIYGSHTMSELIEKIGLEDTKKYLPIYRAIKEEQQYDKAGLIDKLNRLLKDYETLYDFTQKVFEQAKRYMNNEIRYRVVFGGLEDAFNEFEPL